MTATVLGGPHRFAKRIPDGHSDPLVDKWRAWQKAARLRPATVTRRTRLVDRFASDLKINPVTACPEDVMEWVNANPQWAQVTAGAYVEHLRAWFEWLQSQGHRRDNPMELLKTPERPRGLPRPISDADWRRLMATRMHRRTWVMILLAGLAGLRVHEIAKLKASDVDLGTMRIHVEGKGRKKDFVPCHPRIAMAARLMPRTGLWFPSRTDPTKPVLPESVSQIISRTMDRAGVHGTPHALRHWFATSQLERGADVLTVSLNMRHASVATTQIYTRITDGRRAQAVDALDPFEELP